MKIKWTDSQKEDRILIKNVSLNYSKKRVLVPTQRYFNGAYMEETVHGLTTKTRQRKKSMTSTDKGEVEGSFNLKKSRSNNMHTFFNYNTSEYSGYLEGIIYEVTYKTTIHNMHKLGWKAQFSSLQML